MSDLQAASIMLEAAGIFMEAAEAFQKAVALQAEIEGMKAENEYRASRGNSIAYAQEHFDESLDRYGLRKTRP